MRIVTIRTDKPEAEIAIYDGLEPLASYKWQAHRQLAETLHGSLRSMLAERNVSLNDIEGIIVFKGPGSFTGLRIGVSVANALATANRLPIIGAISEEWQAQGAKRLLSGENDQIVIPEYGAPVHITAPRK